MKKFLFCILFLLPLFTTAQITGLRRVCTGGTVTLTDAAPTSGGTWSASNTNVAFTAIGSASAQVTGVSQGTAIITYSTGDTFKITVNTYISPVTGTPEFCITGTAQFSDATTGGVWSSSNTAIGTIGSASGTLTGIKRGSLTITYTLTNACITGDYRTFNTLVDTPVNAITGTNNICVGTGALLSNTTTGGTWTTGNSSIAIVASNGYVTGLANGTTGISYTLYNTCGITQAAKIITVNILAAPINGPNNIYTSTSTQYNNIVAGGSWYLDDSTNASINTSTGILTTSTTAATVVISYIVNNSCGSSGSQLTVNISYVNPSPGTQRVYDSIANLTLNEILDIETEAGNTDKGILSAVIDPTSANSVFFSGSGLSQTGVFIDQTNNASAFIDQVTKMSAFVDSAGNAALVDIIRQNNALISEMGQGSTSQKSLDSINFKLDSANFLLRDIDQWTHFMFNALQEIVENTQYATPTIVTLAATGTVTIPINSVIVGGYTTAAGVKLLSSDITGGSTADYAFISGAVPPQITLQSFYGTTSHVVTAVHACVLFVVLLN